MAEHSRHSLAVRGGHLDSSRALLDAGVDVNQPLSDGTSPLVLSVMNAHYELAGCSSNVEQTRTLTRRLDRLIRSPGRDVTTPVSICLGRCRQEISTASNWSGNW